MNKSAQQGIIDPKLIIGGAVVLIVVFFIATGNFKFSASVNKNSQQASGGNQSQETSTPESKPKTYQSEKYGIFLEYPANWSIKENPSSEYVVAFYSPKEGSGDKYTEFLGVKVVDTSSKPNYTLVELADLWENQTRDASQDTGFNVTDRKSSQVSGVEAKDIEYKAKYQGEDMQGIVRVVLNNKKAYLFQYNALEKDFTKYRSAIETILSSVKF